MRCVIALTVFGSALATVGCMHPSAPAFGLGSAAPAKPEPAGTAGQQTPQELAPKPAAAVCLHMAEGMERDGKDADALVYYQRARELDPALKDRAGHRIAILCDRLDDQTAAMKEFTELLQHKPKDSALLNDIGYSHYNRGQWAEAEGYLRKAVAADKGNKRAWVNLGLAQGQQGKFSEATVSFGKAVGPAEVQANLGFLYATQGKGAEAAEAYRRALSLEPAMSVAQVALRKIEAGQVPPAPVPPG